MESSVNYGDEFLSPDLFKWYSTNNRTLKSQEVQKIIHAEEIGMDIHIFVQKDKLQGSRFYYLGKGLPVKSTVQEAKMLDKNGKTLPVVHMNMIMEQPVEHKLYHYLIEE